MELSKTLNRNPALTMTAAGGIIALAIFLIIHQVQGSGSKSGIKAFFTTDDGKTWFTDEATRPFPFDHDGAQAYRVRVFQCGGGKPFAGYLESLPEFLLAELNGSAGSKWQGRFAILQSSSDQILVKKPGDANWTKPGHRKQYAKIITPACPDGGGHDATPVNPNQ